MQEAPVGGTGASGTSVILGVFLSTKKMVSNSTMGSKGMLKPFNLDGFKN